MHKHNKKKSKHTANLILFYFIIHFHSNIFLHQFGKMNKQTKHTKQILILILTLTYRTPKLKPSLNKQSTKKNKQTRIKKHKMQH